MNEESELELPLFIEYLRSPEPKTVLDDLHAANYLERLQTALADIAKQKLTSEQDEEGDIEYGYNEIIRIARAALPHP